MARTLQSIALCLMLALACRPASAQISFGAGTTESAPAPGPAPALSSATLDLPPFSRVQVCAPFNLVIAPGSSYQVSAVAEPQVLQSLSASVQNGTLQVQTTKPFNTTQAIKVQVLLPAGNLTAVIIASPLSEVTLAPGFSSPSFTLTSTFSSGNVNVLGFSVGKLFIQTSGTGQIIFNGTAANATVLASGTGSVYLLGVNTSVAVDLSGVTSLFLRNARAAVTITGSATGINSVFFNRGLCLLSSPFIGLGPCKQVSIIPVPSIDPTFTCGLTVSGNFSCAASNAAAGLAVAPSAAAPALAEAAPVTPAAEEPPASPAPPAGPGSPLVVRGIQTAQAVGAPGQPATAIAVNTAAPGEPASSEASSETEGAPATASSTSITGRRLQQIINTGSGTVASSAFNEPAVACASGAGNQNAVSQSIGTSSAVASSVASSGTPSSIGCAPLPVVNTPASAAAGTPITGSAASFTGTQFGTAARTGNAASVTSSQCAVNDLSSLQIFQNASG